MLRFVRGRDEKACWGGGGGGERKGLIWMQSKEEGGENTKRLSIATLYFDRPAPVYHCLYLYLYLYPTFCK